MCMAVNIQSVQASQLPAAAPHQANTEGGGSGGGVLSPPAAATGRRSFNQENVEYKKSAVRNMSITSLEGRNPRRPLPPSTTA
ncbi:hypothetical protein E2C01_074817 [Portunus trituberculatus]|uniref:Uncharacterized protein n=1 Tax=Portunus trituberculatus TaxID=210409 RepID=A0A5B7ID78_PORTR|nr:hypothetical protein [Portunus trituberculatus]